MIAQPQQEVAPPLAVDAERWVIGSMLIRPECIPVVMGLVGARDLSDSAHRAVFTTIINRHQSNSPIDVGLIAREVQQRLPAGDSAAALIGEIGESVPTAAHAEHYAKIVAEVSRKRRLFEITDSARYASQNGHTSAQVINELWSDLEDIKRDADPNADEIASHPLHKFMDLDFPNNYLIEDAITEAQGGVLAARSKSLKTTVAGEAVISLATGTKFLGNYYVAAPRRCGIISAESGGATLQESFKRIAESKGIDAKQIKNIEVSTKLPHLVTPQGRDSLERHIDKHSLECLFVDPTYSAFAGVDDSNLSQMAEVLFPVSEIIDRTGCTICFVHHHRKTPRVQGKHYDEPTMEDIGGTGWQQWARFFLLLNRRREWDPETGRHWLWFKTSGSAGFGSRYFLNVHEGRRSDDGGRVWEVDLQKPAEGEEAEREQRESEKDSAKMEADRRKVCNALAEHPDGLTNSRTQDLSGVSRRRWDLVRETMLDEGEIEVCEVTVGNQKTPRQGIKLASTEIT